MLYGICKSVGTGRRELWERGWRCNVGRHKGSVIACLELHYKVDLYCETHKTVNTRNIYGMLLCCEK